MDTYTRWEDVPDHLKTKTALKKMGLKLKRGATPAAVKTHWDYKIPDYDLYNVSEAVPNVVTDKQRAAADKAQQASLVKRTCTGCGYVEELSRHYRGKVYVRAGLCPHCREQERHESDRVEAIEWARQTLLAPGVLIMDTETTDLDGEIIELALINLKGETIYNQRFNPLSAINPKAQAVHGLSAEVLAGEPRFADEFTTILGHLTTSSMVLTYNAAFDVERFIHTCRLHGKQGYSFLVHCLMEWYAQYVNQWSRYHQSYRWQPLNGDHTALGDCRAALGVLREMAGGE